MDERGDYGLNLGGANRNCMEQMSLNPRRILWLLAALLMAAELSVRAADGTALWTNVFKGAANSDDGANSLAVDGSGNVYVTGFSTNSGSGYDFATIKYSSSGVPLWTNLFNGAGNGNDFASSLAVDGSGNVYVTGYSTGSGNNYDYATIKYSSAGVPLWTNLFNGVGSGNDYVTSLVLDGSGNVYVTGQSSGSGSGFDYATIKYSSAGVPVWTNLYNSSGNYNDFALSLAVDVSGNVYVTGDSYNSANADYATIKYSSAGVPLWTNRFDGVLRGNDIAYSLAVDGSGNVYVTGRSTGSGIGGIRFDYATIKYSSAGVPLWTNLYNGAGNSDDEAHSLAVDGSGDVYVTGYSIGNGSGYDYATIKYSSAGVPLWTNIYNGAGNTNDYSQSLKMDSSGNVYVTGYSTGSGNNYDYATIKYSSAGVPLWTNLFNGAGNTNDYAWALTVDGSGNVYVTGQSTGIGSGYDFVTIKYSGQVVSVTNLMASGWGLANQQFHFTLTGPAGSNAVIAASTNLLNWTPLVTNPLTLGSLSFTDAVSTNFPRRFYRATLQ